MEVKVDVRILAVMAMKKENPNLNFFFKGDDKTTMYFTLSKETMQKIFLKVRECIKDRKADSALISMKVGIKIPKEWEFDHEYGIISFELDGVTYNFKLKEAWTKKLIAIICY